MPWFMDCWVPKEKENEAFIIIKGKKYKRIKVYNDLLPLGLDNEKCKKDKEINKDFSTVLFKLFLLIIIFSDIVIFLDILLKKKH